jgi:Bacterial protein of unknown function (DUF903)
MRLTLLSILILAFTSCSQHQLWKIQLKDGRELLAVTEPAYQGKTGYYRYENQMGRDALVQGREVLLIERQ